MASILNPITAVHDIAKALHDHKIPSQLAGLLTNAVTSGFGIVDDMLEIVVNLTEPTSTPTPPTPTPPVPPTPTSGP